MGTPEQCVKSVQVKKKDTGTKKQCSHLITLENIKNQKALGFLVLPGVIKWERYESLIFIVKFEQISNIAVVFLLLTLGKEIFDYLLHLHCVKSVRIGSFSGPCFPPFGLNTEKYSASLRIQSKCGKILTRKTPNTGTFYAVLSKTQRKLYCIKQ